jgi:hypothetical protein
MKTQLFALCFFSLTANASINVMVCSPRQVADGGYGFVLERPAKGKFQMDLAEITFAGSRDVFSARRASVNISHPQNRCLATLSLKDDPEHYHLRLSFYPRQAPVVDHFYAAELKFRVRGETIPVEFQHMLCQVEPRFLKELRQACR